MMNNNFEFKKLTYSNEELKQIIDLIKNNLDPYFTLEFFIWKHIKNPFGKSFGLTVWDSDRLIGLRLFMQWEFIVPFDNEVIRGIRPVDTVVHSDYRGLGLFKKLTLKGLDQIDGNYEFVFNTPNSNSLPGYLKMGWEKIADSCFFKLGLINPFFPTSQLSHLNLKEFKNPILTACETNKTKEFLTWRYQNEKYEINCIGKDIIIYSKIRLKGIKTIVVHELIGDPGNFGLLIRSVAKNSGSWLVYYYNSYVLPSKLFIKTIKRQKATIVSKNLPNTTSIKFSLGDLEGIL